MTDVDENLLTAAKLGEQVRGDLDGNTDLHSHIGLIEDHHDRKVLSFLQEEIDLDEDLIQSVTRTLASDAAANALFTGNSSVLSNVVGVTESDLDGSRLRISIELNNAMENNGATSFILAVGNPNTGKTNTMALLAEIRKAALDDLLILSNIRSWGLTDHVVTSAHDLAVTLLEHRETPKFVLIDEASTHMDARTYRKQVAQQFTPLAKRFAKLGVDVFGAIGHTGKDVHPEPKRLTTLAFDKLEKDAVEFYERWPADSDRPADRLFGGPVTDLEKASSSYDPDDTAPWAWDLQSELFATDLDWAEFLQELK